MDPNLTAEQGETLPLKNETKLNTSLPMAAARQSIGTPTFIISTLLAAIIPTVKLTIGAIYKGQCHIDERIPTYMIVAGIFGLILVVLSILLAVTFMCFISDSATLTILASCGLCLNVMISVLISLFLFIWFILGCVWTFSVHSKVQYTDPKLSNYCQPVLYKSTFALLIITIVWAVLQCCFSCCKSMFTSSRQS